MTASAATELKKVLRHLEGAFDEHDIGMVGEAIGMLEPVVEAIGKESDKTRAEIVVFKSHVPGRFALFPDLPHISWTYSISLGEYEACLRAVDLFTDRYSAEAKALDWCRRAGLNGEVVPVWGEEGS